ASLGQPLSRPAGRSAGVKRVLFALALLLFVGGFLAGAAGRGRPAVLPLPGALLAAWLLWCSPTARERFAGFVGRRWEALAGHAPSDGKLRRRAALLFVALPGVWFFLSNNRPAGTGDTWPVVPTAAHLVRQGTLEVGDYVALAPLPYYLPDEDR